MNKKKQILIAALCTSAAITAPVALSILVTSCNSNTSDIAAVGGNSELNIPAEILTSIYPVVVNNISTIKSESDVDNAAKILKQQINEIPIFKTNNISVNNVSMNKTTTNNVDYYAPSISFVSKGSVEIVWPNNDTNFNIENNTISVKNPIEASYVKTLNVSADTIAIINQKVTDVIHNLVSPESNETIESSIKEQVNNIPELKDNGIQVASVSLENSQTDDFTQEYSVSLQFESKHPLTFDDNSDLNVGSNNTLSTRLPIQSSSKLPINISNADLNKVYSIINQKLSAFTKNKSILALKDSIVAELQLLDFVTANNMLINNFSLKEDKQSNPDYISYYARFDFSSNDRAIIFASNDSNFNISGNSLTLKKPIQTQVLQVVEIDDSILDEVYNQINTCITNVSDYQSESGIKASLTSLVNSLPSLNKKGVSVKQVELTKSISSDEFEAYSVSIELQCDKEFEIVGKNPNLKIIGTTLSTTKPIKTRISTVAKIDSSQLDQIFDVISRQVKVIRNQNQVLGVQGDIANMVNGLNFMVSQKVKVNNVVLQPANSEYSDSFEYNVAFELTSKKRIQIQDNPKFIINGNTLILSSPVASSIIKDLSLDDSFLVDVQNAFQRAILSVDENEPLDSVKTKVIKQVNNIPVLNMNKIRVFKKFCGEPQ